MVNQKPPLLLRGRRVQRKVSAGVTQEVKKINAFWRGSIYTTVSANEIEKVCVCVALFRKMFGGFFCVCLSNACEFLGDVRKEQN